MRKHLRELAHNDVHHSMKGDKLFIGFIGLMSIYMLIVVLTYL